MDYLIDLLDIPLAGNQIEDALFSNEEGGE